MKIVVIGSSTGGPYILEEIFSRFPKISAVIIIIQHLPPTFTFTFRSHLSALTSMDVVIGSEAHQITEGQIIVAPSGKHLLLEKNRIIRLDDGEKIHGVRPAADFTMLSLKQRVEDRFLGIVLTGMGQDGAKGIVHINSLKGMTIVQDPSTAAIMSMPQAAIETGMVTEVLPPSGIRRVLLNFAPSVNR
jgi:two-component system chemotaxis response regulator CheB